MLPAILQRMSTTADANTQANKSQGVQSVKNQSSDAQFASYKGGHARATN